MNNICFGSADILLPAFMSDKNKSEKWAVVACDQFTSEPSYWKKARDIVGNAPSSLDLILPEAFLSDNTGNRLDLISEKMKEYSRDVLKEYKDAMIYVRRTVSGGKIRHGIVGKIDLESYDYAVGSRSAVRATEGTVLERIPPRVAVRRAAMLELPHILLLIDDADKTVIEPLDGRIDRMQKLYDFELMQDGGHIEGYLVGEEIQSEIIGSFCDLFAKSKSDIRFAVGDGNHSLASAKARYEELKNEIGDAALNHPLRYALCETVNLHDESLEFEPIYRLVKTDNAEKLLDALSEYGASLQSGSQRVYWKRGNTSGEISLGIGSHTLTVGTLQKFLDTYKLENPGIETDYIHGLDTVKRLAEDENCIAFTFEGMRKEDLFCSVEKDGALPRKTFSMGEARDKRYYIECRKIAK